MTMPSLLSLCERLRDFVIIIQAITRTGEHERKVNRESASTTPFFKSDLATNNKRPRDMIFLIKKFLPMQIFGGCIYIK